MILHSEETLHCGGATVLIAEEESRNRKKNNTGVTAVSSWWSVASGAHEQSNDPGKVVVCVKRVSNFKMNKL